MAELTGVLLAAGVSSRFGTNKHLIEIHGQALIAHSAAALAPCDRIIAVVRAEDEALQAVLITLGVDCVINPQPARGMGYSIACAVNATAQGSGWCILPADMPYVMASTTRRVVEALRAGAGLAAPYYQGRRGHPVGFSARFHGALAVLDGDSGARRILEQHAEQLTAIATEDAGVLKDIDTPGDLDVQRLTHKQGQIL